MADSTLALDVVKADGKKAGSVELPAALFDVKTNIPLIHQVVVAQRAAASWATTTWWISGTLVCTSKIAAGNSTEPVFLPEVSTTSMDAFAISLTPPSLRCGRRRCDHEHRARRP